MSTALKFSQIKLAAEYEAEALRASEGMDRRRFMNWAGWLGVLGSLEVALLGFLRFLFLSISRRASVRRRGGGGIRGAYLYI